MLMKSMWSMYINKLSSVQYHYTLYVQLTVAVWPHHITTVFFPGKRARAIVWKVKGIASLQSYKEFAVTPQLGRMWEGEYGIVWFIKCVYDHSSYPAYSLHSVLVIVDELSLFVGLHDLVKKAYCI